MDNQFDIKKFFLWQIAFIGSILVPFSLDWLDRFFSPVGVGYYLFGSSISYAYMFFSFFIGGAISIGLWLIAIYKYRGMHAWIYTFLTFIVIGLSWGHYFVNNFE